MAKNKHSVALFEVIHASRSSSGMDSLRTPKWWFKRRAVIGSMSGEHRVAAVEPLASLPEPPPVPAVFEPQNMDTAPLAVSTPSSTALDLSHDPDRRRISFHFTYNSAIISAFAVIVVVSLAYIVGQHMKQGPSTALAGPSSEQVQAGSINKNVMNVSSASFGGSNAAPASTAKKPAITNVDKVDSNAPTPTPVVRNTAPAGAGSPTTAPSGERIRGLNYVVVQGYPPEEKAMAIEACDLLNKNGVPCSIETNIDGFKRSWFLVISMTGYDKVSGKDYTALENSIRSVGTKFGPKAKFKKFEPQPLKWKGVEKSIG